jgi:hypothetical protein
VLIKIIELRLILSRIFMGAVGILCSILFCDFLSSPTASKTAENLLDFDSQWGDFPAIFPPSPLHKQPWQLPFVFSTTPYHTILLSHVSLTAVVLEYVAVHAIIKNSSSFLQDAKAKSALNIFTNAPAGLQFQYWICHQLEMGKSKSSNADHNQHFTTVTNQINPLLLAVLQFNF